MKYKALNGKKEMFRTYKISDIYNSSITLRIL